MAERVSSLGGKADRSVAAGQCAAAGDGLFHRQARSRRSPAQRVAFGTSGHRGSAFDNAFNEAHILAITQAICDHRKRPGHQRPAVHRHRHARAVRAGAGQRAGGARRQRRRDDDRRAGRLHADAGHLPRHPDLQPRPHDGPGRRHRHHARRTIRPRTAASSTTRRTAGRPTPTSPAGSSSTANALLERRPATACGASPTTRARKSPHVHRARLCRRPTSPTSRNVVDMEAIRASGVKIGIDPLGGAAVHYWAADHRALRHRRDRRQRGGRPDLPLHDRRLGRQDPHGLLVALCDGAADRACATDSTSPSPTTPTPTGTASSPARAG